MTEDESIMMVEVGNSFWRSLGELAARHIAMMPKAVEDEVVARLQEQCSIYGTCYSDTLPAARNRVAAMAASKLFKCNVTGCCNDVSKPNGHKPLEAICSDCGHQLVEVVKTGLVFCSNHQDFCGLEWLSIKEVPPGCFKN